MKRTNVFLLAIALPLWAVGCSGNGDDTPTQSPTEAAATPTTEPTAAPTLTPTPAQVTPTPEPLTENLGRLVVHTGVDGVTWESGSLSGDTEGDGTFIYIDGEEAAFSVGAAQLGAAWGQHTITPLDLIPGGDSDDDAVINMSRFLLSLDQDGQSGNGTVISQAVAEQVTKSMTELGMGAVKWGDSQGVDDLINHVVAAAGNFEGHSLGAVDAGQAQSLLEAGLDENNVFRRNVSKDPLLESHKSKLNVLTSYVTARKADGTELEGKTKPLVVTYAEEIPETDGALDVFAAISLDDGATFKRFNLSQSAEKSSWSRPDGTAIMGDSGKPNIKVASSNMLVTWTDRYCPNGNPGDIPDEADIYQVTGPQGSVNFAAQDRPDLGEQPYMCMWASRGWVNGDGTITFLKAEQMTSGRRDAKADFIAGVGGVGFGVMWQEDPDGLRLGDGDGPGDGGSGAIVNHQTDIWYSYVRWSDFKKIDPDYDPQGDPDRQNDDAEPRGVPLVKMSAPVPVTDNAACRQDEYGVWKGAAYCEDICTEVNEDGVCITEDGRLLAGNTGASRPNVFMIPKTKTLPDGSTEKTAWLILGYEETKGEGEGGGGGQPDDTPTPTPEPVDPYDIGKRVTFHTFNEFDAPEVIARGDVLSEPDLNARRVRFVVQPGSNAGPADVRIVTLYREGDEGKGRYADIKVRVATGGYKFSNFGPAINVSSPTILASEPTSDPDGETVKVTEWEWTEDNLDDGWDENPYDDSRAHRAQVRGDFIVLGFTWTPNWSAASNGNDHYDFYVRRSFDGGVTFTNAAGEYEQPLNLSNLQNHKLSVIEPRIVGTPGTIKNPDGTATGFEEDKQNKHVYYVAYGTEYNGTEGEAPADLFFSRTTDQGETYERVTKVNNATGEVEEVFDWLAQGDESQGECQLRMTPAGNRFFATWMQNSTREEDPQSDVWFRKVEY